MSDPDNSEELSFIVPLQKMGSEFLTPDNSEEISLIVSIQKMGSEYLTPDNSGENILYSVYTENGFRISDPG